jgi:hypothetical protein
VGSFYTNITLRTKERARVRDELAAQGRTAYLSRVDGDAVVVFDRDCEEQDIAVLRTLAGGLSQRLACTALAVMNHDDDILLYTLFESGRMTDAYNSDPDYFGDGHDSDSSGGDAARLAAAFGRPDAAREIGGILSTSETVVFETDRHAQLVAALHAPRSAVGTGFSYLEADEYPEDYTEADFDLIEAAG